MTLVACGTEETKTSCFDAETTVVELRIQGGVSIASREVDAQLAPDGGVQPSCHDACENWNFGNAPCKVGTVAACAVDSQDGGRDGSAIIRCRVEYAPYCRTDPGPPC